MQEEVGSPIEGDQVQGEEAHMGQKDTILGW